MNDKVVAPQKNLGGRPRKHVPKTGVTRETRVPIDGRRDILTIENKDPNMHYAWVLDDSENGYKIQQHLRAAYEFVQADRQESVGQPHVYKSASQGSLIRVPNGTTGQHLYLMKLPMYLHLEDKDALERKNKELEQSLETTGEGQYLKDLKITRN